MPARTSKPVQATHDHDHEHEAGSCNNLMCCPGSFKQSFGSFLHTLRKLPFLAASIDCVLIVLSALYHGFGDIFSALLDYALSNRSHISLVNSCDDLLNEKRWTRWVDEDTDESGQPIAPQPANILTRSTIGETLLCANLCRLAYESVHIMTDVQQAWGIRIEEVVTRTSPPEAHVPYNTCAFVSTVREEDGSLCIVVAFRGTQPFELSQWVTDASVFTMPLCNDCEMKHIQIHEGFAAAVQLEHATIHGPSATVARPTSASSSSSSSAFSSAPVAAASISVSNSATPDFQQPLYVHLGHILLRLAKGSGKVRIVITGHSLGAALASVFSFAIATRWKNELLPMVSGVYLFGQPKVGNGEFANFMHNTYGNRTRRVVNHNDLVCRVPSLGFSHYGACLYLNGAEKTLEVTASSVTRFDPYSLDTMYSWKRLLEPHVMWLRRLYWLLLPSAINDHFPGDYVRAIRKVKDKNFDVLYKPPQPLPMAIA